MMVAAFLAIHLLGHGHLGKVTTRDYKVHGWVVKVRGDNFTGKLTCQVEARRIRYSRETLIVHTGGADTTHAYFRLDGASPRSVRDAFAEDEAHGFFPERGWIVDPSGGDVALPASYLKNAKRLYIRLSPKAHLRVFDVSRFPEALSRAQAAGCFDRLPETVTGSAAP